MIKNQSTNEKKFVIIIGSGFHKEAHGDNVYNYLTDWSHFLKSIGSSSSESQNYILDFELLVAEKTRKQSEKNASKIELDLLKKLTKKIELDQIKVLTGTDTKYPLKIFNPHKVSDVISLNFDLVPEILINNGKIPKTRYCNHIFTEGERIISKKIGITRHRIIGNKKNGSITFWHPHGDIMAPDSIQLGIRKYGKSINEVELLRKRFKASEESKSKKTSDYIESWYDKIINQPVIILGASLSDNEWDLWFALINKIRNFSKADNKKYESKIYKMISKGEELRSNVFTELYPNSKDFKEQWQYIRDQLS
jgi:hypothetical protein